MKMKNSTSIIVIAIMLVMTLFSGLAAAAEMKMVGTVAKIGMAADGKSAAVVLKDSKTGAEVSIIVNDEMTLDKFKDKRIVDGDEIRCKYDNETGKNVSKIFRKTAGC